MNTCDHIFNVSLSEQHSCVKSACGGVKDGEALLTNCVPRSFENSDEAGIQYAK